MCLWLLDVSVKTLCRVSHESRIKQTCDVIRPHTHPHIANTAPMKWALIGLVSVDQIEIEVFNNHISLFFKHLSLRLFIRPSTHHVHFFAYSRRVWHRPCVSYRLKQEVICHQRFWQPQPRRRLVSPPNDWSSADPIKQSLSEALQLQKKRPLRPTFTHQPERL